MAYTFYLMQFDNMAHGTHSGMYVCMYVCVCVYIYIYIFLNSRFKYRKIKESMASYRTTF